MRVRIVLSCGQEFVREQVIESAWTIVGRDPACDVVINDASVSKRHLKLELSDEGFFLEDMASLNGVRINGVVVGRQALKHLDVIEIGSHKLHVFDDALLPEGGFNLESTIQRMEAAATDRSAQEDPLAIDKTEPGTTVIRTGPVYALKRIDERLSDIALLLDQMRTVLGEPGKAALIVRRRDKLVLTKLSRLPLNVNGREVEGASCAVGLGDVIDVGAIRYQVVRVEQIERMADTRPLLEKV